MIYKFDNVSLQYVKDIKRTILVTQRDLPIPDLFGQLIEQREHIALVVDEYGSVSGLVTQEDMIELKSLLN